MVEGKPSPKVTVGAGRMDATTAAEAPEPSTPLSSSGRETVASLLHGYLSAGFCEDCSGVLKERIATLASSGILDSVRMPGSSNGGSPSSVLSAQDLLFCSPNKSPSSVLVSDAYSPSSEASSSTASSYVIKRGYDSGDSPPASGEATSLVGKREHGEFLPVRPPGAAAAAADEDDDLVDAEKMSSEKNLSWQQREQIRFSQVRRKQNFTLMERVEGRMVNVLEGLELHTGVFNSREQKKIVEFVHTLQKMGEAKKLTGRTYSRPKKWMRGKGRVTLQFGCCYNYAIDKDGNPPGIVQDEEVDSLPPLFKMMIKRMVRWHVLPSSCIPNSCIVNIYNEGDCIPPHIDHHDFLRPFCTVSFLSECNILFGSNLKVVGPGEFQGPTAIPLPVGSVLVLNGNGADVAKHCVPGVPTKRISITFRKMDDSCLPYKFSSDPDLQDIQPLQIYSAIIPAQVLKWNQLQQPVKTQQVKKGLPLEETSENHFHLAHHDFPPLGASNSSNKASKLKR